MKTQNIGATARKLGLVGSLGLVALFLSGCSVKPPENGFFNALRMGWPKGVTPEAEQMGNFWVWTWVAAWTIGIIMWGLLFYTMWNYRASKPNTDGEVTEFPRQTGYNIPVELALTITPVIIVMVLFFFTVQAQGFVTADDKDPKVTVDVTGYQWNWKFGYSEIAPELTADGQAYDGADPEAQAKAESTKYDYDAEGNQEVGPIHGRSQFDMSYLQYNKIETLGTTEEIPVLVVPTDTAIEFNLASADVIHSFWVPEFLFKRDAFPHPEENKSKAEFQITSIDEPGSYVGRCAEMCGTYHSMMNFEIRAVTPDEFRSYIQFRQDNPDATNADALRSIGQEPFATSTSPFVTGREDTKSQDNAIERNV